MIINKRILAIILTLTTISGQMLCNNDISNNSVTTVNENNENNYEKITLDHLLSINSNFIDSYRIVIYSFRDYFNNPNWGATLASDYYQLMNGNRLKISNVPHIEINDSNQAMSLIVSFKSLDYLGDNFSNYPIIPYSIKAFAIKSALMLLPWDEDRNWSIKSILLIYTPRKSNPDILINYENKIVYNGYGFKLTGSSAYESLLDSLNNETPTVSNIYY